MAFFIERPIPERPYFKVGDAAHILGVAPSTVRYWQKEFPNHIKAELSRSGQNVFSRCDVIVMAVILNLVRTDGMSIKEARTRLSEVISEHSGRIDRIPLCLQFELPLAADETPSPAADAPDCEIARSLLQAAAAPVEVAQINVSVPGVRERGFDDREVAADRRVIEVLTEKAALSDELDRMRADNAMLRDELDRMQADLDSQLSMNESLAEENLRFKRTLAALQTANEGLFDSMAATVRQMIESVDR